MYLELLKQALMLKHRGEFFKKEALMEFQLINATSRWAASELGFVKGFVGFVKGKVQPDISASPSLQLTFTS